MAINLDGNGVNTTGLINSATAQASTSGTSIDFTGIPSGVKRITVMFDGVSTNGTSLKQVQVGSGSIVTTGYVSTSSLIQGGVGTSTVNATTGWGIYANAANDFLYGHMVITAFGSNIWVCSSNIRARSDYNVIGAGDIALSGALDRVRITTVNGTDTFDAGSINILYE
jgi:hypothetical protein